jgi:hypothetical protein
MPTTRLRPPLAAILTVAALATVPTAVTAAPPATVDAGAAEHAALPYRAFIWSLIVNVGREGAAEHAGLR